MSIRERVEQELAQIEERIVEHERQAMAVQMAYAALQSQREMLKRLLGDDEGDAPDPPAGPAATPPPPRPQSPPKPKAQPAAKKAASTSKTRKPLSMQLEAVREVFQSNPGRWLSSRDVARLAGGKVTSAGVAAQILRTEWKELGLEREGARQNLRYRLPSNAAS